MVVPKFLLERNVGVKAGTRKQVDYLLNLIGISNPPAYCYRYSINTVVYLGKGGYGSLSHAESEGHRLHPFEVVLPKPLIRRKV